MPRDGPGEGGERELEFGDLLDGHTGGHAGGDRLHGLGRVLAEHVSACASALSCSSAPIRCMTAECGPISPLSVSADLCWQSDQNPYSAIGGNGLPRRVDRIDGRFSVSSSVTAYTLPPVTR